MEIRIQLSSWSCSETVDLPKASSARKLKIEKRIFFSEVMIQLILQIWLSIKVAFIQIFTAKNGQINTFFKLSKVPIFSQMTMQSP